MDIGDSPHAAPWQQGIGPRQYGLIDPPRTPLYHILILLQRLVVGHQQQLPNLLSAVLQALAAGPVVPKIAISNINKIEQILDSKKNNWTM